MARKLGQMLLMRDGDAVIKELTGGGVHYSFEAIGLKFARKAFQMLRIGGTGDRDDTTRRWSLFEASILSERKKIQGFSWDQTGFQ